MIIKEGATIQGLDIEMRPVLIVADKIWSKYGQELVITSGLDGTHSAGSLHYYGRALDFRTHYFTDQQEIDSVFMELVAGLDGAKFDFLKHSTHIHVEYDPKW